MLNLNVFNTMNQDFKLKQSAVISNLNDYAAIAAAMVGDISMGIDAGFSCLPECLVLTLRYTSECFDSYNDI
jgi:hypothetical protein